MSLGANHQDKQKCEQACALLTAPQVAELLQVSVRSLWRLRSSGRLPEPVKLGSATRWRRAELEEWIEARCPTIHSSKALKFKSCDDRR